MFTNKGEQILRGAFSCDNDTEITSTVVPFYWTSLPTHDSRFALSFTPPTDSNSTGTEESGTSTIESSMGTGTISNITGNAQH